MNEKSVANIHLEVRPCHTSNLQIYPNAESIALANQLNALGYTHLGQPLIKWQIECYPRPALIEIFQLPERLKYKKGRVADNQTDQITLAKWLLSLRQAQTLKMTIPEPLLNCFEAQQISTNQKVIGSPSDGYIYAPKDAPFLAQPAQPCQGS